MSNLVEPQKTHRVRYSIGYTANTGNFESLRVDLGLEADGAGNPDATLRRVREWVEDNFAQAFQEVRDAIEKGA